ncbi:hypothetical protein LCGC14_1934760 [marine sediment metagenome]|uniref:Terminase large subunit gp17-like C-terminal domain-containing protein n=1 Tax=marine sediment metagenome TaxID=412755 RepID=A0A0F9FMH0_9ZZZZ
MPRVKDTDIRKPYVGMELTSQQILEFEKCRRDPIYFIRTYVVIQHPTLGAVPFDLWDFQEDMIHAFHEERWNIVLSARQTGKSTCSAAYILWFSIFNFDKYILIASNKNKNAMEMVHRIKYAYKGLPMWLKPGVLEDGWNKHSVAFENGTRIDSTATSEDSGRTFSVSLLYLDEFAFVKQQMQEDFWTSIEPTLSQGGACIISSTPNGDVNLFAQIWRGALVKANSFYPTRVEWEQPPGRDEAFKEDTIGRIGPHKWKQEYECEFLSSDPLLINSVVVNNLEHYKQDATFEKNGVYFWKKFEKDKTYLIGVDPATGTGKDFSVIEIVEFPSLEQVAEFRSNSMSSAKVYTILKWLLSVIEKSGAIAYFSVENNGVGEGVISLYEADEHPPEAAEFVSEEGKKKRGMVTTKKIKMKACMNLKHMVEKDKVKISSSILVRELKTFVMRAGQYQAQTGSTDDCISAMLIITRLLIDIATYEQQAHDMLYVVDGNEYLEEDSYDQNDQGLPMIF